MNSNATPQLIQRLEDVNEAVALVETAWHNLSMRQEIGIRFGGELTQFTVARSLFVEAVEGWAMAVSELLTLSRRDAELRRLTDCLEYSLRCASGYLASLALADPRQPLTEVPLTRFAPRQA
jgi:hypothetical protein